MTNEETAATNAADLAEAAAEQPQLAPVDTGPVFFTHGDREFEIKPVDAPLRPVSDRVLVRRLPKVQVVDLGEGEGIILPEVAQEEQHAGIIIDVGPGRFGETGQHIPMSLKVGDQVHFPIAAGYSVGDEKDELLMLTQDDCLGVRRAAEEA